MRRRCIGIGANSGLISVAILGWTAHFGRVAREILTRSASEEESGRNTFPRLRFGLVWDAKVARSLGSAGVAV